jgi:hypothetical protein
MARWQPLVDDERCQLALRIGHALSAPGRGREWMLMRPPDPGATEAALRPLQGVHTQAFGEFLVAWVTPPRQSAASAMRTAITVWRRTARSSPGVWDFRAATRTYRTALDLVQQGVCSAR